MKRNVTYHQKLLASSGKFFKERAEHVKVTLTNVSIHCQDFELFCTLKSTKQPEVYMTNVRINFVVEQILWMKASSASYGASNLVTN
jgi:hypothetical protein